MIFRRIADLGEVDLLVSRSMNASASARWVTGVLERGQSRLSWCRMAISEGEQVLAAHVMDSWSPDAGPGKIPTFVQLLGHVDEAAATSLLVHDLAATGARDVQVRLSSDADAPAQLRAMREQQHQVLAAAGFDLTVERVRVHRHGDAPPLPRQPARLTFQPAATAATAEVVEIFAAVGDASLDHAMTTGRAEHGRDGEATRRLDRALRRTHDEDWLVLGLDEAGAPVGYVQAAIAEGGPAILAEVGVVQPRRGHGYVDDLLAHATATLAARGHPQVRAFTDTANHPMRAAFTRAGYSETGTRHDFRRPPPAGS